MKKASIFWCTGMSGVGKSTLSEYAKSELENHGYNILIIDGDVVRENYDIKLGFGKNDVENNNLNVARICKKERYNYDAILVPIISPLEIVRCTVRNILSPGFYLLCITADIESLKNRDPKGLYKKVDDGDINDLIGYSNSNPYEMPIDYELLVNTSKKSDIKKSKEIFTQFVLKKCLNHLTN